MRRSDPHAVWPSAAPTMGGLIASRQMRASLVAARPALNDHQAHGHRDEQRDQRGRAGASPRRMVKGILLLTLSRRASGRLARLSCA
jgi:hypothetical protein